MRAFEAGAGGFHSALEPWERVVLEDLVREVAGVLRPSRPTASQRQGNAASAQAGDGVANAGGAGTGGHHEAAHLPPGVREGESLADAQTLAALDFTPEDDSEGLFPGTVSAGGDPALGILLPQASEDPQLAAELAELTREPLREDKHRRLVIVARELLAPSGQDGAVMVPFKQLPDWLGALNDLRLFLSQRLEITTPQAAEAVHDEVLEAPSISAPPEAHLRHVRVVLYEMVTWWQESLLAAVEEN